MAKGAGNPLDNVVPGGQIVDMLCIKYAVELENFAEFSLR